jgi:hypothetical protein
MIVDPLSLSLKKIEKALTTHLRYLADDFRDIFYRVGVEGFEVNVALCGGSESRCECCFVIWRLSDDNDVVLSSDIQGLMNLDARLAEDRHSFTESTW